MARNQGCENDMFQSHVDDTKMREGAGNGGDERGKRRSHARVRVSSERRCMNDESDEDLVL